MLLTGAPRLESFQALFVYMAVSLALTAFGGPVIAQAPSSAPAGSAAPKPTQQCGLPGTDASQCIPLPASSDVSGSVSVDADLLPFSVSKRIFGKEIATHFAAIELVISNRDKNSSMVVQSVILDYSHWLFSGNFAALGAKTSSGNATQTYQAANMPSQVASAESRLVRSALQDAQQWSARNWVVRSAILIGSATVGFQALAGQTYAQVSNAFNGTVVPGLQHFWPDEIQLQINHISDFGFTTNHLIPPNSSDVIVAFFPLDRFLTPDLQQIFRDAPAAFFNPSEMLIDSHYSIVLLNVLRRAGALTGEVSPEKGKLTSDQVTSNKSDSVALATTLKHYEQFKLKHPVPSDGNAAAITAADAKEMSDLAGACASTGSDSLNQNDCLILSMLNKVSLNNIRVIASGIMTVDTASVSAKITDVQFSSDETLEASWKKDTTDKKTATIVGTFLSGSQVSVTGKGPKGEALDKPLDQIEMDPSSNDNKLIFTYVLPNDVADGSTLNFIVSKKSKDGTSTQSSFPKTISHPTTPAQPVAPATQTKPDQSTATPQGATPSAPAAPSAEAKKKKAK